MAEFKDRLRELRIQKGFTLRDLASEIGVDFPVIYKYEHGIVVNPKLSNIVKLAKLLGTTPEYLAGFVDDAKRV